MTLLLNMIMTTTRRASIALLALGLPAAAWANCANLKIEDPWIREAPPGAMTRVGFAQLSNKGTTPLTITGASSPDFASVELHLSSLEAGQARMRHVETLTLDPGQVVRLEPGSYHLMLMQASRPLASGDESLIELRCDTTSAVVKFPVRPPQVLKYQPPGSD